MMTLYHGSNCEVRNPSPTKGRRGTDFGQGFYLTPDMDSARAMASVVTAREGIGRSTINVYQFDEDLSVSLGLNIQRFDQMDLDWMSFVIANRNFERQAPNHNIDGLYDIVVGCIADDKIANLMRLYRQELITIDKMLEVLKSKPWRVLQYSFHSRVALKCLTLEEVWHEQ